MIIQAESGVVEGLLKNNFWLEISNGIISNIQDGKNESADKTVAGILIPGFVVRWLPQGRGRAKPALWQSSRAMPTDGKTPQGG